MSNDDKGDLLVTVMWCVAIVPMFFVSLRLWVRTSLSRAYGWDDTVIVLASAILVAYAGVITKAVDYGVGRHYYTILDINSLTNAYKFIYIGQPLAIMACAFSKSSFGLMLLRVVTNKWERVLLWYIIISINVVMFLCALFQFIQCKNPAYGWDKRIKTTCWPVNSFVAYAVFSGAYSGACDFVLAFWPWFVLSRLQMKNREKAAVGFAMSLGIFAGVAACIKTSYLPALSKQIDYTYAGVDVLIWGGSETGLTIIASCIGTYRPLFKKLVHFATSGHEKDSYYVLEGVRVKRSIASSGNTSARTRAYTDPDLPYWPEGGLTATVRGRDSTNDLEAGFGEDGRSDKAIFARVQTPEHKIKKTTDVHISYKQRDGL